MTRLIVLFNLKPGLEAADYERWALETDLPTARGLPSIDAFGLSRAAGLLIGEGTSPYQYVEVIDINSMDQFWKDLATDAMQAIAAKFQEMTDHPVFILTDPLD